MGMLSQTREIVLLNLRSIPSRLGASPVSYTHLTLPTSDLV